MNIKFIILVFGIVILFIVALFISTTNSSNGNNGMSKEEYDKVVSERDSLKAQLEENSNSSSSSIDSKSESLVSKTIKFENENSAIFTLYEENNKITGGVACSFDGNDVQKEIIRMTVFTYIMKQLEISDFNIIIQSNEDVGMYSYKGGELSSLSMPLAKYSEIIDFESQEAQDELKYIAEQLKDAFDAVN